MWISIGTIATSGILNFLCCSLSYMALNKAVLISITAAWIGSYYISTCSKALYVFIFYVDVVLLELIDFKVHPVL